MDVDGQVVAVTGASKGIGAATAVELGRRGWRVVVDHRRSPDAAQDVVRRVREAGGDAVAVTADVTDPDGAATLVATATREFGRLDALVCNATAPVRFADVEAVEWEELAGEVRRELAAAFHPTRAAVPALRASGGGRIVYVSSDMAGQAAVPGGVAHGTAKAALDAFARYAAVTYGPSGITAVVVSPGPVRTDNAADVVPDDVREAMAARSPLRRPLTPDDVAATIAMLVDDGGVALTGATVAVTGGRHLGR